MNDSDTGGYRVEVSGWGANESCLLEKSTLIWSESTGNGWR